MAIRDQIKQPDNSRSLVVLTLCSCHHSFSFYFSCTTFTSPHCSAYLLRLASSLSHPAVRVFVLHGDLILRLLSQIMFSQLILQLREVSIPLFNFWLDYLVGLVSFFKFNGFVSRFIFGSALIKLK